MPAAAILLLCGAVWHSKKDLTVHGAGFSEQSSITGDLCVCMWHRARGRHFFRGHRIASASLCAMLFCSLSQCLLTVQEIYVYAYGFTLEKGIKCLPQEVAIEMWRLLFSARPWPLLESWCVLLPDTAPLSRHFAAKGNVACLLMKAAVQCAPLAAAGTLVQPPCQDAWQRPCPDSDSAERDIWGRAQPRSRAVCTYGHKEGCD